MTSRNQFELAQTAVRRLARKELEFMRSARGTTYEDGKTDQTYWFTDGEKIYPVCVYGDRTVILSTPFNPRHDLTGIPGRRRELDTAINRDRQRYGGYEDAMRGREYGLSNELGALWPDLEKAYNDGWNAGIAMKQFYEFRG